MNGNNIFLRSEAVAMWKTEKFSGVTYHLEKLDPKATAGFFFGYHKINCIEVSYNTTHFEVNKQRNKGRYKGISKM